MKNKTFIIFLSVLFLSISAVFLNSKYFFGVKNVIAASPCGGNTTITDSRDGQVYDIVEIGTQCWMAENLNAGVRISSKSGGNLVNQKNNQFAGQIEKYCWNDNSANCATYGGYYQWHEAMNLPLACDNNNSCLSSITYPHQGICPSGWHIPSDVEDTGNPALNNDWYTLENYLKNSGQSCSATRDDVWDCDNAGAKIRQGGSSGLQIGTFGSILIDGSWVDMGVDGHYWSSSRTASSQSDSAWGRDFDDHTSHKDEVNRIGKVKKRGLNVRCVKDSVPTFTISGNVFGDINKNLHMDAGESAIVGAVVTSSGGTITVNNGSYQVQGLIEGTYTISYTSAPPVGFYILYPKPSSFVVTVGSNCAADSTTGASCAGGNITNLNFAVTNSFSWIQTYGLDIRVDDGFRNLQPVNTLCGGGSYAMGTAGSFNIPGVVFSGAANPDFGRGSSSSKGWVVGGMVYPEVLKGAASLKTSTQNLMAAAAKAGIQILPLESIGTCFNPSISCNLQGMQKGFYHTSADVRIDRNADFDNGNYVIVSDGTIRIVNNRKITADSTDSVVIFSARDIIIDSSISASVNACPVAIGQLQGIFSADRDIIVEGNNGNCTGAADKMLNIDGTVIANAARGAGSFKNKRDLCGDNLNYPSITIKARPDFILHTPGFLTEQNIISNEETP